MPAFLCPRCGARERGEERHQLHQPRGCSRCGFGFLFELLEDYYPSPRTALIVCDSDRRVLVAGHAAAAVTGHLEGTLLGQEVVDALGLRFGDGDPVEKSLEWGVRVLNVDCTFRPRGLEADRAATLDVFPAYDDDGGVMLALTPS